jgi:hypothetical protein
MCPCVLGVTLVLCLCVLGLHLHQVLPLCAPVQAVALCRLLLCVGWLRPPPVRVLRGMCLLQWLGTLCMVCLLRVTGLLLCLLGQHRYQVLPQCVLRLHLHQVLPLCVLRLHLHKVLPLWVLRLHLHQVLPLCVLRLHLHQVLPLCVLRLHLLHLHQVMHMLMQMLMLLCVRKPLGPRMGGVWVGCPPFLSWVLFMVGQSLAHMLSLCRLAGPPPVWGLV